MVVPAGFSLSRSAFGSRGPQLVRKWALLKVLELGTYLPLALWHALHLDGQGRGVVSELCLEDPSLEENDKDGR